MQITDISWADLSWNPGRGCSYVSPGCGIIAGQGHCYVPGQLVQASGVKFGQEIPPSNFWHGFIAWNPKNNRYDWTGKVALMNHKLLEPIHEKKWPASKVFSDSTFDLFHREFTDAQILQVFHVMLQEPRHIYEILTKRADRMNDFIRQYFPAQCPLPRNIWVGVSVESQEYIRRAELLADLPIPVKVYSIEPMLGPVTLTAKVLASKGQNWFLCEGQSGRDAQPFDAAWALDLRDQCRRSGFPFYMKQLGAVPILNGQPIEFNRRGDGHNKDWDIWPEALNGIKVREFPRMPDPWAALCHPGYHDLAFPKKAKTGTDDPATKVLLAPAPSPTPPPTPASPIKWATPTLTVTKGDRSDIGCKKIKNQVMVEAGKKAWATRRINAMKG